MKILLAYVAALATLPLPAQQNPATMPRIAAISPRFQSYNIEMVEVIGGRFWKPYASNAAAPPPASANPAASTPRSSSSAPPLALPATLDIPCTINLRAKAVRRSRRSTLSAHTRYTEVQT